MLRLPENLQLFCIMYVNHHGGDLIQFAFRVVFDKKPCYLYPDILRYLDNRLTSQIEDVELSLYKLIIIGVIKSSI